MTASAPPPPSAASGRPIRRLPTPWVTYTLIGANLVMFAVAAALGVDPIDPDGRRLLALGANGMYTLGHQPWRLFTSMFLHAGLLHLTFNMLALYQTGQQVELIYGRSGMATLYLMAGLLGALTSAMRGAVVSVGASGAIFGLFGAFGYFLLRHRKRLDPQASQAALRNLLVVLAINLYIGLRVPQIDMAAHVGGLFGGALTAWALEQQPRGWSMLRRALLVGGIGVATLTVVGYVLPARAPHVSEAVRSFDATSQPILDRANQILDQRQAGKLTAAAAADAFDADVVAPWREARRSLETSEVGVAVRRLARAQEDALVAMAQALRAGDEAALKRAVEEFKRVGR